MSQGKHVLVAGGAGFIGSHLCDVLVARGDRVTCLDNLHTGHLDNLGALQGHSRFQFVQADICDPLPVSVTQERFSAIYNLACAASPLQYQRDPEHTLLTNIVGTRQLLRLAERCEARFLQASTSEIYGDPEMHPQRETYWGHVNPVGPRACYDEGKRAAETLCAIYEDEARVTTRIARIFNTYGPRLHGGDGRLIPNVIGQTLAGLPVTIFGDGTQTRSFCFVDDTVRGLITLMDHEGSSPGPINLGNPHEITVRALVDQVLELTGSSSVIAFGPLPADDPQRRRPDTTRAQDLLDWQPRIPLPDGLRATIAWFRQEAERALSRRAPDEAVPVSL